ncbi:hypothetical protein PUR71_07075 [Streptomyces sp. SP17BM10]|uniref:hypothetical protein n=1 Tax=Streptomyces sp. SP17BM10 TaxID=3002530 RepID=UPI002E75F620|nr:hypothetical protein [Streptomyces sp. SP17BM10]MEE1782684.1 hypothetical protein [Streptomyces sp. SP17BM10]
MDQMGIDKSRHLLSRRRYTEDANGAPVTFTEDAEAKRADLGKDRTAPGDGVRISPLKALVIASLLEEYSRRIDEGVKTGELDHSARDHGSLAQELAEHLQALGGLR